MLCGELINGVSWQHEFGQLDGVIGAHSTCCCHCSGNVEMHSMVHNACLCIVCPLEYWALFGVMVRHAITTPISQREQMAPPRLDTFATRWKRWPCQERGFLEFASIVPAWVVIANAWACQVTGACICGTWVGHNPSQSQAVIFLYTSKNYSWLNLLHCVCAVLQHSDFLSGL